MNEKVVQVILKTTYDPHYYKFRGKIYRQAKGGAISLGATGSLARIMMDIRMQLFMNDCERLGIPIIHIMKYVNDVLLVTTKCEKGVRFNPKDNTLY